MQLTVAAYSFILIHAGAIAKVRRFGVPTAKLIVTQIQIVIQFSNVITEHVM